jgi:hypothetical protein
MKHFLLSTVLCITLISAFSIYAEERRLNIIYTGALQGELEPCGCSPQSDFGGLARFSGFLNDHRDSLSPYILIDAGNFLAEESPQGRLKADAMIRSFGVLKYDAVALLPNEDAVKDDFVIPLLRKHSVPTVTFGLHNETSASISKDSLDIHISVDPEDCPDGRLNILLTDHPVSAASGIPGWDVIISSSGEMVERPLKIGHTLITSGYPKGEKFGVLTLTVSEEGDVLRSRHEWIPLGNEIEEDSTVRKILDDYDMKVARFYRESLKPLPGTTYLGVSGCVECHQPFAESWEKTRHAGAYSSLLNVGKASDPECIICHVVGFGEIGGFFSMETTPELANVQCEECHGVNREHITDFSKMRPVTESVCLKCHTRENSPEFEYHEYLDKIKHD